MRFSVTLATTLVFLAIPLGASTAHAQAVPEKPKVVEMTDFNYLGKPVRSIWTTKRHANGVVTIVCNYWPRENQTLVGSNSFQARLEVDPVGSYIACHEKPGQITEKLYLGASKTNRLGIQISRSINSGSAGSVKDAGSFPYTEPMDQYFAEVNRLHNEFNAYLVRRDNLLDPLHQKMLQSYYKTMFNSAMGWFDVGIESKRHRWDD